MVFFSHLSILGYGEYKVLWNRVVATLASQAIRWEGSFFLVLILLFPSNHLLLDLCYGQELLKWKKWHKDSLWLNAIQPCYLQISFLFYCLVEMEWRPGAHLFPGDRINLVCFTSLVWFSIFLINALPCLSCHLFRPLSCVDSWWLSLALGDDDLLCSLVTVTSGSLCPFVSCGLGRPVPSRLALDDAIRHKPLNMSSRFSPRVAGENDFLQTVINKVIAAKEVNHKGQGMYSIDLFL